MTAVVDHWFVFPADVESSLSRDEGEALAELAMEKTVLELGAWQGCSTICMGQTAKLLYSVDWHRGDDHSGRSLTLNAYWQNLGRYGLADRVVTIIGRFDEVLSGLADDWFDLIFLDGFHSYEQVRDDIDRCEQHVKAGGTLAFHDYGVKASSEGGVPFGVTRAVEERFGRPARVVDTLAIVEV